ncbi:hypothetical protein [Escherichia phage PJNS034]
MDDENEVITDSVIRPEDDYEGFLAMMNGESVTAEPESDENEIPVDPDEAVDEENDEPLPADEDEEESETEEEEEELPAEENDEEEAEEDDSPLEVDLDTVITLPDGTERTIEELTQGFADNTLIAEREQALKAKEDEYASQYADLSDKLKLAKLEADDVLEKFEGFDWNALLQESPEEFGKTKMFVERYQKRSQDIQKAMADLNAKEAKKAETENQAKAVECVRSLQKNIPGWSNGLYHQILEYAVNSGVDEKYITTCTDASVLKAFYDSMRLAKGENVVKAKVKKAVKSPSRVVSAQAKKSTASKKPVNTTGLQGSEASEFTEFLKFI